jgi:hypothetical protein
VYFRQEIQVGSRWIPGLADSQNIPANQTGTFVAAAVSDEFFTITQDTTTPPTS